MTLISASLLFAGSSLRAEKIIGSVDQKGSVTYSDHVPAGAVKSREVKVDPIFPSQESRNATRDTTQQMIDAAAQSREGVENVRAIREELAEKRRSSIEADMHRSQEMAPVSADDGYVIDRDGYVTEQEPGYVRDQGPGYVKEQEAEYIKEREPEYIQEREPEYIQEREPKYIE